MRHFFVCSSAVLCLAAGTPVQAQHGTHGHHQHPPQGHAHAQPVSEATQDVHVHDCWVRLMPAGLPSAAYFRLDNPGATEVALTSVATDAYAHVMLHATREAGGMSHMHHVDAVKVAAHGALDFAPGGYHLMLEDATRALEVGQNIALKFEFAGAAPIAVPCAVRAANAVGGEQHHHHH